MLAASSLGPDDELADAEDDVRRLLGGESSGVRIRAWDGSDDVGDTVREMSITLGGWRADAVVERPSAKNVARALSVLADEKERRRLLDSALTTFGRRLIDPLAAMLETRSVRARLGVLRDIFVAQARELRLTHATEQMLVDDVRKMLGDEYLGALAECEEREQKPRVQELAQKILRAVGATFHRAFGSWRDWTEQLAHAVVTRMPERLEIREVPLAIEMHTIAAIEEVLWLSTSADLQGEIDALVAARKDVIGETRVTVERRLYRELAEACWNVIAERC